MHTMCIGPFSVCVCVCVCWYVFRVCVCWCVCVSMVYVWFVHVCVCEMAKYRTSTHLYYHPIAVCMHTMCIGPFCVCVCVCLHTCVFRVCMCAHMLCMQASLSEPHTSDTTSGLYMCVCVLVRKEHTSLFSLKLSHCVQ